MPSIDKEKLRRSIKETIIELEQLAGSRRKLAKRSGVSYETIRGWVEEISFPTLDRLALIANAVGMTTTQLVSRIENSAKGVYLMNRLPQFIQQWLLEKGISKEELQRRLFEEEELEPEIFEQIFSGELVPDEDQLGAIAGVMQTDMEWDEWLELIGKQVVDAPTEEAESQEEVDDNHLIGNGG